MPAITVVTISRSRAYVRQHVGGVVSVLDAIDTQLREETDEDARVSAFGQDGEQTPLAMIGQRSPTFVLAAFIRAFPQCIQTQRTRSKSAA